MERAGRADPLLLRHARRCLGGISSTRGDPRPAGPRHRPTRPMGGRYRRNPVASTGPASRNTARWTGYLAGMPAGRPPVSRTRGRHRRPIGGTATWRGPRMARRRRPPARPRQGRGGLRVIRPPSGRHRLGRDRRRPSEPGSSPQDPTFPERHDQLLTARHYRRSPSRSTISIHSRSTIQEVMTLNRADRISNRSVGQFDPKNWFAEGDGLLASATKTRELWTNHRGEFSQTIQERKSHARDSSSDWNLLLGLPRSSMLLLGYSVEMYLKAGLVRAYYGCSEEMFSRDIRSRFAHRLLPMANEIAFSLNHDDESNLNDLTDMILFDARYPVFVPNNASYSDTVNQQTQRVWSAQNFTILAELAKRIRQHSKTIDADSANPASLDSFSVDADGYLAFRTGGHLPPRITYRASSIQLKNGKTSPDDMKALFPTSRFPRLRYHWKHAWIYEDGRTKTSCRARPAP